MNAYEKSSKSLLEKPDILPDIRIRIPKIRISGYPVSGFKISIRYNPSTYLMFVNAFFK